MLLSRLRLITFDITDTLLQFKLTPGQQYGRTSALFGINCDQNELSNSFKRQWHKMNLSHPNFGLNTGLGWEKWWHILVVETFRDSKVVVDDNKLDQIAAHLIEVYKVKSCWRVCDGVNDLLSFIRSKKIPMGVISNFDPRLCATLVNVKLRHYFKFILTSYEAGFEKPHPEIFLQAMNLSNVCGLRPEECLHIGDQVCLDYDGAIKSGWKAVLINQTDKNLLKQKYPHLETNYVFNNLYGLHKYLIKTAGDNLKL